MGELWKQYERWLAKYFDAERNPINGRGDEADVENNALVIEAKEREKLPAWLKDAMTQAVTALEVSDDKDRIPLVALHEKGAIHEGNYKSRTGDLVVLRIQDFKRLIPHK